MKMAGFTLLEVVVTLAIVVALSALVVPSVSGRLGGESAKAMSREIAAGVSMARTDAIRESAARRVVFVTDGSGRVTRLVSRPMEERGATAEAPRFVGPVLDDPAPVVGAPREAGEVLLLEMPRGTRVSRRAPVVEGVGADGMDDVGGADSGGGDAGPLEPESENWDPARGESALTLGVLLPTGAAVAGSVVYVTLPGEVTLEVRMDGWTGDAVVTRWTPPGREDEWVTDDAGETGESSGSGARGNSRGERSGAGGTGRSVGER